MFVVWNVPSTLVPFPGWQKKRKVLQKTVAPSLRERELRVRVRVCTRHSAYSLRTDRVEPPSHRVLNRVPITVVKVRKRCQDGTVAVLRPPCSPRWACQGSKTATSIEVDRTSAYPVKQQKATAINCCCGGGDGGGSVTGGAAACLLSAHPIRRCRASEWIETGTR